MANDDPILNFIDSLPVQGMSLGNKVILLTVVLSVILAAIMTLISVYSSSRKGGAKAGGNGHQMRYQALKNDEDKSMAIKIDLDALYIAQENTEEAHNRGKLSSGSYYKLIKLYDTEIKVLENKLSEMGESYNQDEFDAAEEVQEVVSEFEDLTQAVPANKPPARTADPFMPKVQTPPVIPPVTAKTDVKKTAPAPESFQPQVPTVAESKAPPMPGGKPVAPPPPSGKVSIPPPPSAKPAAPPVSQKSSIPSPASIKPSIPSPQKPDQVTSVSPFEAQNPMAGQQEDKDKFAQSTSIAALRSDMLRELARLRKYIDEGEDE